MRATLLSTVRGAAMHRLFSRGDARGLKQMEFILELLSLWSEAQGNADRRKGKAR